MKIWYDDIIYSLQRAGGISVMWSHITKRVPYEASHLQYDNSKINSLGIQIDGHQYKKLSSRLILIKRYINPRLTNEKDSFLFHSSYYRYCKNNKAVNITTVYDFIYEFYDKRPIALIHKFQKKRAVMHSDGVICISESTKKDLKKLYPSYKGDIRVVYCGYDTDTYYFENISKENIILSVGARNTYKRFDLTVQIVKELQDCNLVIVGGGDLSKTEKQILDCEIPGRYEKIGYLSNEELRHLYNKAFFLSYCSDYEGFGIPPLEAQACGCPVICQAKSSLPEVVGESAIFIEPNNMSSSLRIVKNLYNRDFYNDIVNKGFENVKRFSWDRCQEEVLKFYNEITERKRETKIK